MESADVMDTFSGTFGLTGAADTLILLVKDTRKMADAMLYITGRDIEPAEYALEFDRKNLTWNVIGSGFAIRNTGKQQILYDALVEHSSLQNPLSPKDIEQITGLDGKYIRNTLPKFVQDGSIKKVDRGNYCYLGDID